MLMESLVDGINVVQKQSTFQNWDQMHKRWTAGGDSASKASTHRQIQDNCFCCHFEHLSHLKQSPCKKCLTWCCSLLSACYQHLYISMLRYAYSMAGEPTIVPKNGRNVKLGQASSLSHVDKLKINRLYQCGSYRKNI